MKNYISCNIRCCRGLLSVTILTTSTCLQEIQTFINHRHDNTSSHTIDGEL